MFSSLIHQSAVQHFVMGAAGGWASAAKVDFEAFKHWQSFSDVAAYSWSTALFRWIQGAVIGGVLTSGLGGVIQ